MNPYLPFMARDAIVTGKCGFRRRFTLSAVNFGQPDFKLLRQLLRLLFIRGTTDKQFTLGLIGHIGGINFVTSATVIVFNIREMHVWPQARSDLKLAQFHNFYRFCFLL